MLNQRHRFRILRVVIHDLRRTWARGVVNNPRLFEPGTGPFPPLTL